MYKVVHVNTVLLVSDPIIETSISLQPSASLVDVSDSEEEEEKEEQQQWRKGKVR